MQAIERTGVDYYIQVSDVYLLKSLVSLLPLNSVCVNIGAAYGTSALAMLETRPDVTVVSIDLKDCPEEEKAIGQSGFDQENRYQFFKGYSQVIGLTWLPQSVDLVFVDGDHSYQGCAEDGKNWYNALKKDGLMVFHDYGADITPYVKPAVDAVSSLLNLQEVACIGKMKVFRKV